MSKCHTAAIKKFPKYRLSTPEIDHTHETFGCLKEMANSGNSAAFFASVIEKVRILPRRISDMANSHGMLDMKNQ